MRSARLELFNFSKFAAGTASSARTFEWRSDRDAERIGVLSSLVWMAITCPALVEDDYRLQSLTARQFQKPGQPGFTFCFSVARPPAVRRIPAA